MLLRHYKVKKQIQLLLSDMGLNFTDPLICGFLSINVQLALCIPRFLIPGFNQPRINQKSIPRGYPDDLVKFLRRQKLYADFVLYVGTSDPNSHIV